MQHLKKLVLSHSYFEQIPDQSLIAGENGKGYSRVVATRGKDYAMMYTYTGEDIWVQMGKIRGDRVKASWYSPLDGTLTVIGEYENAGTHEFDPPGEPAGENDWVLVLEEVY